MKKDQQKAQSRGEAQRKLLRKKLNAAHEIQAAELQKDSHLEIIMKRTKEANLHLESTNNYVNPYLFRYTLMMRLGIGLAKAPKDVLMPLDAVVTKLPPALYHTLQAALVALA